MNDLVAFSINNSSGTILTYSWNFGPFGNSINANPTVKLTSQGTYLVVCDLMLLGGGICSDTHEIKVLPNPIPFTRLDSTSDSCFRKNNICFANKFIKGSRGFATLNLLWGDGNLSLFSAPLANSWCHTYGDTGTFYAYLELKDSAGCIGSVTYPVHILESPVATGFADVAFGCDSSKVCFYLHSKGGKSFKYQWYYGNPEKKIGNDSFLCKWERPNIFSLPRFTVTNEFGCTYDSVLGINVPDSVIKFENLKHAYCRKQVELGFDLESNISGTWNYNGVNLGVGRRLRIATAKPGWNYVKISTGAPCPSFQLDSFWMFDLHARAKLWNHWQVRYPGIIDTVWFKDISPVPAGSKMSRVWSFQDDSMTADPPDTTWEEQNIKKGINANFNLDSVAWHYYKARCPVVLLTIYDSTTGCSADTALEVYNAESCRGVVKKGPICLGNMVGLDISVGAYKRIDSMSYFLSDIHVPRDSFEVDGPSTPYLYKTMGKKSPVFMRRYNDDSVWTKRHDSIVLDYVRKSAGWVKDTFLNYIDVLYIPNANFNLKQISCNPYVVMLDFVDSFWFYPDSIIILWGDSNQTIKGFTDTIGSLPTVFHTFTSAIDQDIGVLLVTKKHCTAKGLKHITMGSKAFFTPSFYCGNTACFKDSSLDLWDKKKWTAANKKGQLYWDFGDGKVDSGFSMCHKFDSAGSYRVKLLAVGASGCRDTAVHRIGFGEARAAIKSLPAIYCAEIRKYFDSSYYNGFKDSATIIKWEWSFGDGTKPVPLQDPVHVYAKGGTYHARLIITNRLGCKDTAYRDFNVVGPTIKAMIISDSVGCPPLVVRFANLSSKASNYIWKFGDSNNSFYSTKSDTSVSFTYTKPGVYYAHLIGGDSVNNPNTGNTYYCSITYPDTGDKQMRLRLRESLKVNMTAPDTLCTYDSVLLTNQGDTTYTKYFYWDFGNGHSLVRKFGDVKYQYPEAGKYTLRLYPYRFTGPLIPCADTAQADITVLDAVPDFSMDCGTADGVRFRFNNLTKPSDYNFIWSYRNDWDTAFKTMGYTKNILYNFGSDTGTKVVCLRLNAGPYCAEKTCKPVRLNSSIYLANVFTPGAKDGLNDTYKLPLHGFRDFELRIFNRWGELIFLTKDPFNEWNGKVNNTGSELPTGTYFYQLNYRDECGDGKVRMARGSITLIR